MEFSRSYGLVPGSGRVESGSVTSAAAIVSGMRFRCPVANTAAEDQVRIDAGLYCCAELVAVRLSAVRKLVTGAAERHVVRRGGLNLTEVPIFARRERGWQLAHEGADKRTARRTGLLHPQGQAPLRNLRAAGRLRLAQEGTGRAYRRGDPAEGEAMSHQRPPRQGGHIRQHYANLQPHPLMIIGQRIRSGP